VATAAKTLSLSFYGKQVEHSYFEGCSNGGRQAMMMAQNYPELFDGIVAARPSMFYPDLLSGSSGQARPSRRSYGQPPALSFATASSITQRVLDKCDGIDGLVDGQITNPRACSFDIDALGPAGEKLLTAQELATVKAMYAGTTSESGQQRYAGAKFGSEGELRSQLRGQRALRPFVGHYVYSLDCPWLNGGQHQLLHRLRPREGGALAGDGRAEPGHPGFRQPRRQVDPVPRLERLRGTAGWLGRLLLRADPVRAGPPHAQGGRRPLHREAHPPPRRGARGGVRQEVQQYHRLFMLPAVSHCGGGTGPNAIGGGAPSPLPRFAIPSTTS